MNRPDPGADPLRFHAKGRERFTDLRAAVFARVAEDELYEAVRDRAEKLRRGGHVTAAQIEQLVDKALDTFYPVQD